MTSNRVKMLVGLVVCALVMWAAMPSGSVLQGQAPAGVQAPAVAQAPPASQALQPVPKNLRPLLLPKPSEMRLVVTRYTLDRATLQGNYLGGSGSGSGGGARGGGRGGAAAAPVEPLSPNRIARLKRFDLDWQVALEKLDAARLSTAGAADLASLRTAVADNLARLDAAAASLASVAPLVPFAPDIVRLVEARIRIEDVNAQQAAGVLTAIARQVADIKSSVDAGLAANPAAGSLRPGTELATRGASAIATLRSALGEWFTFYNGYDPLFTWWVGLPFKRVDAALQDYAALLKDQVAPAAHPAAAESAGSLAPIPPAPAPSFSSVPDLAELMALPHDEMADIVSRFRGPGGGGGRGGVQPAGVPAPASGQPQRGEQPQAAAPAPAVRDRAFYQAWLAALKALDFKSLSRNAQVDYLFIRTMAEQQLARDGVVLPANPPRKADTSGIPGPARGRQGLIVDLQDEFIPYTPDELIALAEVEFAWCDREMKKASAQLGLGDDWKRAMEKVKGMHPPPGGQASVIRDLVFEAIDYLRAKDLLTVPAVAAESQLMIMMTPERQLVNPFFTGGSQISVSYPTDTMEYDARIQSMRGNNTPFSHATAFHEMIPGHNLVGYTGARYGAYRARLGSNSPFYGEGWPLYWELLLYDLGFHDTPEKKIGALFWRMHRCARIIFSLKFHMGEWSPQECVDFLIDRVGFERDNAMGEVRRSFQGGYGPLYQAAYLLGGLQLRSLRREIVDSGQMGQKAFHDEILRQGGMPIALLRLALGRQPLTRETKVEWRFIDRP